MLNKVCQHPKGSILIQYRDVNTAINQRRPMFQGSMAGSAANSAWELELEASFKGKGSSWDHEVWEAGVNQNVRSRKRAQHGKLRLCWVLNNV